MPDNDALTGRQKFLMKIVDALIWPASLFPRGALFSVGAAGGRMAFRLWARRRRIAVANIKMIQENGFLPADLNAEKVAEESFANMGRTVMESLSLYHKGFDSVAEYCRVEEGLDNFEAARAIAAEGQGLLMVTGHMGNWEVMCRHTSRFLGRPITIVGRESGHPLADTLVRRLRTGEGDSFVPKDGGAREMMKTLRTGGVLGTLIDQAAIGHNPGTPLPFMGREATTNLGPLRLAQKTGVPVLMLLFRRDGLYHCVKAMPLFKVGDFGEGEEGLTAAAAHLNQWLGERIRQYPDQWMWGHRRWKTTMGVWHNPESIT
ncbi:lysophospholipid acyltransferase family protein [Deltaproteobacteria bacterium OttesenSCG-928-K17]|nr:lysophospholipid acyltransferase family protein [Deltaproteobacteria bacterium OttesenSCG-928-K17]